MPEKISFTVADLWRVYLVDYTNRSNKDSSRLKVAWNHLRLMFESVHVQDLTTGMVNEYIASRREAGIGNGTINRETALLSAMFHLVDRIPVFPKRLTEPPARKGFVTDKEYAVLARNAKPLWLRALIALAYAFGFRRGELFNLRVRQVDLMDRLIQLEEARRRQRGAKDSYDFRSI